jgi:hypothetical protein
MLPGEPITILITAGGRTRAAFVLPISEAEGLRLVGTARPQRDRLADVLWEEDRLADFMLPDDELDARREESHAS